MKIRINNNVFDILDRLKQINKYYYIVFNTVAKKFELYSSDENKSGYVLTLPYDSLDVRSLNYINKTLNSSPVSLREIDEHNEKIRKSKLEKAKSENEYKVSKIYDYSNKKNNNINDVFKNIWI